KSIVHREPRQREIAKSLGLGRVHSSVVRPDNAATRGIIFKIAHLVSVEEVNK
ncbi:50S ribosomal protein L30, partial [Oenococcus oeni]